MRYLLIDTNLLRIKDVRMSEVLGQISRNNYKHVLFRELVNEIPSTTYATHGIYYYPAKFIPHVVRYVIKNYTKTGDWVFDPFAGSGTIAIECHLLERNYVLWDINPILEVIVKASTYMDELSLDDLHIDFDYQKTFIPHWSNITYWHPRQFLEVLKRAWGYYHYALSDKKKAIVAIPLLKVTKYFSYADEQIAKLYKSKAAVKKVNRLLKSNWRSKLIRMYNDEALKVVRKIIEFNRLNPKEVEGVVRAGIDSISEELKQEVDIILTSPPYLQAQEYIRSSKLELFWLGYSKKEIRHFRSREIPYNKLEEDVEIKSKLYFEYRRKVEKLKHPKLLQIYDTYFKSLALFFNKNSDMIRKYIAIFVGPVKIRGIRVPIDEVLREHLEGLGWKHEATYIDKIISRKLFETEINPATGLKDERTPTEHLLIMRKVN